MTELMPVPLELLRSVSDLESVCKISADLQPWISQPVFPAKNDVLTAALIASRLLARSYNAAVPESTQQGVLSTLHELHNRIAEFAGYPALSLSAQDSRQAIFASLAMVQKYHQFKQHKRDYVLLCNVMPVVTEVAQKFAYEPRLIEPALIQQQLDHQCAAIVVSLPGLQHDWSFLDSIRASLADWDIPLIADGSGQYFLPDKSSQDETRADILLLDLAHICGLDNGVNAVLGNPSFAQFLPVPVTVQDEKRVSWESVTERPCSIGPLTSCPVNIQAAMHCLVYFRLQGSEALQQQAMQSMIIARYVHMRLVEAGLAMVKQPESTAGLTVSLADTLENTDSLQALIADLALLPLTQALVLDTSQQKIQFSVSRLHQLNLKQVDQLLEMFILHLGKK